MSTSSEFVIPLLLLIAVIVWITRSAARVQDYFQARSCQATSWHQAFPKSSKHDIRLFLSTFVEAFAFHESQTLKFNPNDTILGIYRLLYPHECLPDALEIETFTASIEKLYEVKLEELWSENLTLGELFAATQLAVLARDDTDTFRSTS